MSGSITAGGLITGLDTNNLIRQLLLLDRQPVTRLQARRTELKNQQTAVRDLRSQLQTLRNRFQDFRLTNIFDSYESKSSEPTVLTATVSGATPVVGAFSINVTQLASATVATSSSRMGAAINPAAALNSSGMTPEVSTGTFTINGVQFTVDPSSDSLNDLITAINASSAGVTASYNVSTDRVTIENTMSGDTSLINFGATGDTSNFLSAIAVTQATQLPNMSGSTAATSTRNLGAIDPGGVLNTENFAGGAITAGTFSINGISISIDPSTDRLNDVIERINSSDAEVTASYDASIDGIRVIAKTLGSATIRFGDAGDTSNFLSVTNLSAASQTAGNNATFTINGGAPQTRNANEITDALSGVTLRLLSTGTSTVSVGLDADTIVGKVKELVEAFNSAVQNIRDKTKREGILAGDGTIRAVEDYLRGNIFNKVPGLSGPFESLLDIGISTGKDFSASETAKLELDENKFRQALIDNRLNVERLFSNPDKTGIADVLFAYLDDATSATGFLNARSKANGILDQQMKLLDGQISRIDERLKVKETRLRKQFTSLERLSAGLQNQNNALSGLRNGFRLF
jgi:flagellar hook-associated protein 2